MLQAYKEVAEERGDFQEARRLHHRIVSKRVNPKRKIAMLQAAEVDYSAPQ